MKKLIPALLLFVIALFAMPGAKANAVSTNNAAATKTTVAATSGHWEYWCVYNEETGEFEIVAVWVEDDM
jgi:hypothetical protein